MGGAVQLTRRVKQAKIDSPQRGIQQGTAADTKQPTPIDPWYDLASNRALRAIRSVSRKLSANTLGVYMPRFLALFAIVFSWPALAEESTRDKQAAAELAVQALEKRGIFQDPVDILAWADMPRSATVNETVLLKITVENGRSDASFELDSIDLGGNFRKGFDIKAVRPKPTEMDSMFNTLTLDYSVSIAPRERVVFELELIAKKAGI